MWKPETTCRFSSNFLTWWFIFFLSAFHSIDIPDCIFTNLLLCFLLPIALDNFENELAQSNILYFRIYMIKKNVNVSLYVHKPEKISYVYKFNSIKRSWLFLFFWILFPSKPSAIFVPTGTVWVYPPLVLHMHPNLDLF